MEKPNGLWISKKTNKESISSSWEELAFAEDDAAGSLWPPRSYTCSFCQREFRSAQALGGHMNIHRRDRARLKQSEYHNDRGDIREKSSYSTLVFNSKPNCFYKSQHSCVIDLSSSSSLLFATPSRVSCDLPRNQDSSPSFVVEPTKTSINILPNSPWPRPHANLDQSYNDLCKISIKDGDKKRKIARDRPKNIDITKRRRRHESSSYVSSESCKGDIVTRNEEMIKTKGDLDLELRL